MTIARVSKKHFLAFKNKCHKKISQIEEKVKRKMLFILFTKFVCQKNYKIFEEKGFKHRQKALPLN
jgi:hypothetical protein